MSADVRQTLGHRSEQRIGLLPPTSDRHDRVKRALNQFCLYVAMDAMGRGPWGILAGLVLRNTKAVSSRNSSSQVQVRAAPRRTGHQTKSPFPSWNTR